MANAIVWRRNRTPNTAVAEFIALAPEATVRRYIQFLKRTAGGSVMSNRGNRWPVRTGYSRDRFTYAGRLNRGNIRPPSRILISSAGYAKYPDQSVRPSITNRLWFRFDNNPAMRDVENQIERNSL